MPDREDLRHLETQLWIAADALDGIGESGFAGQADRYGLQSETGSGHFDVRGSLIRG
jgi:hypothetical protein